MKNIDYINLNHELSISYKKFKNGHYQFKAILTIKDSIKYDQIQKNLVTDHFNHWRHFFRVFNIKLIKKNNSTFQINNFPNSLTLKLEQLGFLIVNNNFYTRRKWTQYCYETNNIFEINSVLFNILQHDLHAEKTINSADLFDHI